MRRPTLDILPWWMDPHSDTYKDQWQHLKSIIGEMFFRDPQPPLQILITLSRSPRFPLVMLLAAHIESTNQPEDVLCIALESLYVETVLSTNQGA
jgi:hypothetical protein